MASVWTPRENTASNSSSTVVCCHGDTFTQPLPHNSSLLWLHYSGLFSHHVTILWRAYPIRGNRSVNTFLQQTVSTIGHPLLGNGPGNMPSWQQKTVFSVESVLGSYKRAQSEDRTEYITVVGSSWVDLSQVFGIGSCRYGKKGIRLWQEDSMCDLKLKGDGYKSVARIRLVRTENPRACVTVNWKVCEIAMVLYCL
jgi:hypothetical protein